MNAGISAVTCGLEHVIAGQGRADDDEHGTKQRHGERDGQQQRRDAAAP